MRMTIRSFIIGPLCGLLFCLPAYAQKTKAQLSTEITTTYPDNTSGAITPAGVRSYETDVLNSIMPTAPVVDGNLACFNGTTGLLKDCALAPSTLIVGTTVIQSGTSTRVLFDNSGVVGEYPISGTGNVAMTNSPTLVAPTLGAALATSINGNTFTAGSYTLTGAAAKTLTFNNTLTLAGIDSTTLTFQGTDTYVGRATTDTLTNKTFNCANNTCTVRLGSDVTGNLPLANIATGTQDTVLGYWTGTGLSAIAIGNCTNALTYSTSTHTWGCNTTAGTGTLTEQKNTASVGIVTSGNCDNTSSNSGSPCNVALTLANATLTATPSNPTATSSATATMAGVGGTCHITPVYSGRVRFAIFGVGINNSASTTTLALRYGTGTAPANGASGTSGISQIGAPQGVFANSTGFQIGFHLGGIVTGLSTGTAYWFDLTQAVSGGSGAVQGLTCEAMEF